LKVQELIARHLDLWTSAIQTRATAGRGNGGKSEAYGVRKLKELILDLAIQGKLIPQDSQDIPATEILKELGLKRTRLLKDKQISKSKSPVPPAEPPALQIPVSWVWTTLYELGEISPRNEAEDSTVASFVPMTMISEHYGEPVQHEPRPWKEIKSGFTHFKEGDVVLAKITPCFQNGKSAVMRHLTGGFGAGTTELHVFRPISDKIVPEYVLIYLKSRKFIADGIPKMTGTAGQKRITRDYFAGNHLPLPPFEEQQRIVAKVDELMTLCDQLEQQQTTSLEAHQTLVATLLDTLTRAESAADFQQAWQRIATHFDTLFTTEHSIDQLKQTVLQLAVMGRLVEQDPNEEAAAKLLMRLSQERDDWLLQNSAINAECNTMIRKLAKLSKPPKPFELPESWDCAHLIQISRILVDCHNKTAPYSETGVPIIRTSNIRNGQFFFEDMKYVSEETYLFWSRRCVPESGDIIFTREAPMGEAAIIPNGKTFCLGQRTMLIRPMHSFISTDYLLLTLTEPHLLERASVHAIGSTVKHLRVGDVEELSIPVPPLEEQFRIVRKVKELLVICDNIESKIRNCNEVQRHLANAIVEQAVA